MAATKSSGDGSRELGEWAGLDRELHPTRGIFDQCKEIECCPSLLLEEVMQRQVHPDELLFCQAVAEEVAQTWVKVVFFLVDAFDA
jgi:hypothetical protein